MNECENELHECDQNAFCFDTDDSYGCICEDGFDGDGFNCSVLCFPGTKSSGGTCIDIDECEMNSTICESPNTICKNSFGSYSCACPDGFIGDAENCIKNTMTTTSTFTAGISASGEFISLFHFFWLHIEHKFCHINFISIHDYYVLRRKSNQS